eukprot:6199106-Karenia_brevis.AAC.1
MSLRNGDWLIIGLLLESMGKNMQKIRNVSKKLPGKTSTKVGYMLDAIEKNFHKQLKTNIAINNQQSRTKHQNQQPGQKPKSHPVCTR